MAKNMAIEQNKDICYQLITTPSDKLSVEQIKNGNNLSNIVIQNLPLLAGITAKDAAFISIRYSKGLVLYIPKNAESVETSCSATFSDVLSAIIL